MLCGWHRLSVRYGLRFPGFWINFQSGCLSIVRLTWIGYPSGIVLFFHVSPYICTYSNTLFKYIAQSRCSCLKGRSNVWGPMISVLGLHMTYTNWRMNITIIHAGVNIGVISLYFLDLKLQVSTVQVWKGWWAISAGPCGYICEYGGPCEGTPFGHCQHYFVHPRGWLPSGQSVLLHFWWWCIHADLWYALRDLWIRAEMGAFLQEVQHWATGTRGLLCSQDWLLEG